MNIVSDYENNVLTIVRSERQFSQTVLNRFYSKKTEVILARYPMHGLYVLTLICEHRIVLFYLRENGYLLFLLCGVMKFSLAVFFCDPHVVLTRTLC